MYSNAIEHCSCRTNDGTSDSRPLDFSVLPAFPAPGQPPPDRDEQNQDCVDSDGGVSFRYIAKREAIKHDRGFVPKNELPDAWTLPRPPREDGEEATENDISEGYMPRLRNLPRTS